MTEKWTWVRQTQHVNLISKSLKSKALIPPQYGNENVRIDYDH